VARKHRKQGTSSSPVERTLVAPEVKDRKVVTNPETGEFEVQHVVTPAVYQQGKALRSTTERGKPNTPAGMAPKGGGAGPSVRPVR